MTESNISILNKSIVDCVREPGDAICIEISSTISDKGYFIKNNPHMSDMIYRVFGKDIIAVGGAYLSSIGEDKFYPTILGYKFKKLIIGLPTKPQKYDPENKNGYELLKCVSKENKNAANTRIVPGYLVMSKISDLRLLLGRTIDFATKLGLKKIFIPPLNSFDPQISDSEIIELYNSLLDSRFVIAKS